MKDGKGSLYIDQIWNYLNSRLFLVEYWVVNTVAKFIVPDWEDKVSSGIGLSARPARLHRLAGRYDNPTSQSTISLNQGL
jgi:hypothetical protein